MTEHFQDNLHQEECKQSKGAKICANVRTELECEKFSQTFSKIFTRQNMQNQTNAKHSSNSEVIFKSTKNVLEIPRNKDNSSSTTTSKFLSKIRNRKNLQSNNATFAWLKFFNIKLFNLPHLAILIVIIYFSEKSYSRCKYKIYKKVKLQWQT